MAQLFKKPDAKKATDDEIIKSMSTLSEILADRAINNPNFDADEIYMSLLSNQVFNNAGNIREVFPINNSLIAIPGRPPKMNASMSRADGIHVIPVIHLPGLDPYQAYIQDTETWIDTAATNLDGKRQIHLHRVVPGMIVSFHHFVTKGGSSERKNIFATQLYYDETNELCQQRVDLDQSLINLPDEEDVPRRKGF